MNDEKDVMIKISDIEGDAQLDEFIESAKKIGLIPEEIRQRELPIKPKKLPGNSTKDVMITVVGDANITTEIVKEFLVQVEQEMKLLPASKNEKLLGGV